MKLAHLLALTPFAFACEAENFGDPCDGFFANGCKGNLTCLSDGEGKYCSQSCNINKAFPEESTLCPRDAECVEVGVSQGGVSLGSMGMMCARPK